MIPAGTRPLADLSFSLVGPGRVGLSMTHWLIESGAQLKDVATRLGGGEVLGRPTILPATMNSQGQSLLLIAVPDDALAAVVSRLSQLPQAEVILHTSGAQGAEALASLHEEGQEVGALHPLRPFPAVLPRLVEASATFFAIDGSPRATDLCRRVVTAWGAEAMSIAGPLRPQYHFAAALAAGGTATLFNLSLHLAREVGIPHRATAAFERLAQAAQSAVAEKGAVAITGPVVRGELTVLERLTELQDAKSETYPLLVLLALESLRQVEQQEAAPTTSQARTELRRRLLDLAAQPNFLDALREP